METPTPEPLSPVEIPTLKFLFVLAAAAADMAKRISQASKK